MSDPITDGQTISVLVHQAPTLDEARRRFRSMEGFSMSRRQAENLFEEAARRRFPEQSAFIQAVTASYEVVEKKV